MKEDKKINVSTSEILIFFCAPGMCMNYRLWVKNHRTLKPEIKASDKNILYRYDQRAIPYLESPFVRHTGTFNNEVYFDIIDAVRNGSIEDLNKIMLQNGNEPLSQVEFDDFIQSYLDFQDKVEKMLGVWEP